MGRASTAARDRQGSRAAAPAMATASPAPPEIAIIRI